MPILFYLSLLLSAAGVAGGGGGGGGGSSAAPVDNVTPSQQITSIDAADYKTPEYNAQDGLEAIHAADAYAFLASEDKANDGFGVLVAITDTGVRATHQDIAANLDESLGINLSTDAANPSDLTNDLNGHGTHVMSTAVGVRNGVGIHGVAPRATGFAVKMLNSAGNGSTNITGIPEAVSGGAKVINMSWGTGRGACDGNTNCDSFTILQNDMIAAAQSDVVMVAAAGNVAASSPDAPAIFANSDSTVNTGVNPTVLKQYVLAVVAVDQNSIIPLNDIADFSNRCGIAADHCLAAPGVQITAAFNGSDSDTEILDGTSMATPHVTGAVAIIRGAWPFLTAPEVTDILLTTADDLGNSAIFGHGMLNLSAAVQPVGLNSLSSGNNVASAGYDLRSSSMNLGAMFGDAIQTNVLPQMQEAVFFDQYGRDYKANLASKVTTQSSALNLDNIIFNNNSYQNLPLNFGANGKKSLNFNIADYKNKEAKNPFGLRFLTVDNSIDYAQRAVNNSGFSFVQQDLISPNSTIGFAFNIDEISHLQNSEFAAGNFLLSNNFAANPYQNFFRQNTYFDNQNIRKFNQIFMKQDLMSKKLALNFSYQASFQSPDLISTQQVRQNQATDLSLSFKQKNDDKFVMSVGNLEEFDNNILNSKSIGAFSSGGAVKTSYVKLASINKIAKDLNFISTISEGISTIPGNNIGVFQEFNNVRSRSWSMALIKENFMGGKFGLSYLEPMRVYSGSVKFDIPVARDNFGNVTRFQGSSSLATQGREQDFEIFYSRSFSDFDNLTFNFVMQKEPGNIKNAQDNFVMFGTYKRAF